MENQDVAALFAGCTLLQASMSVRGETLTHHVPQAEPQQYHVATRQENSLAHLRQLALSLVNRDRQQQDSPNLVKNELLNQVAQAHAEDMIRQNYLSHYGKDGNSP